jgi:hypothetical protein
MANHGKAEWTGAEDHVQLQLLPARTPRPRRPSEPHFVAGAKVLIAHNDVPAVIGVL